MKKFKKVLLLSGTALAGMSLLAGCTTASNNNSQSSQSSDKKETKKKSQYDTTDLKEETIKGGKFFTSLPGEWKALTNQGVSFVNVAKGSANISVFIGTNDVILGGTDKTWSSVSKSKIEAALKGFNPTSLEVEKTEINGKEAFKASYKVNTATGTQYYIQLDETHTANVTYTYVKSSDELEKELKHIINTIEYVK